MDAKLQNLIRKIRIGVGDWVDDIPFFLLVMSAAKGMREII